MIFNQKYTTPNIDRLYTSWWNSFAERLSSPNSLALGRVFPTFATRMLSECWFNRPGREAAQTKSMEELAVGSSWRFVDSKTTETTSSHRTIPNVKILGSTKHIYISNSFTCTYNMISYFIYSSHTMYRCKYIHFLYIYIYWYRYM